MVIMTNNSIKILALITIENIKPLVISFHSACLLNFYQFFGILAKSLMNDAIVTINPNFQKVKVV